MKTSTKARDRAITKRKPHKEQPWIVEFYWYDKELFEKWGRKDIFETWIANPIWKFNDIDQARTLLNSHLKASYGQTSINQFLWDGRHWRLYNKITDKFIRFTINSNSVKI
jgi:hypothetical protein